jgi:putative two-component system response regulator
MNETVTPFTRRSRVLVVDDAESIRALFYRLLTADGHDVVSVPDGLAALEEVSRQKPDVMLLDVKMPTMDGLEVCRRLKGDPATQLMPIMLVTGHAALSDRLRGIEAGADEILEKPVHPNELRARVRSLSRVKYLIDALDSAEAAFMALALTIEARDPMTIGHCERLATRAVQVGRALGLPGEELDALHRGGYLHDLGKVGVPDRVLLKPGPLTAGEFELMKQHTVIGDNLCAPLQSLRCVRPIVRSHHERLDGSGYPDGLRGDAIPHLAQIVGVVDVFDALTSSRPYRGPLHPEDAARHLRSEADKGRLSRPYVEALLDTVWRADIAAVH